MTTCAVASDVRPVTRSIAGDDGLTARFTARDAVRLAVFAALTAAATWRYAGVEAHPPVGRLIAISAVTVLAAAALSPTAGRASAPGLVRTSAAMVRGAVIAASLMLAVAAAGVPAHLLLPLNWGKLAHDVNGGVQTIGATLWPYVGHDRWARIDLLLVPAAVAVAAAALAFWPPRSGGRAAALRWGVRQITALALLLAVYVIGVIDSNGGAPAAEGLLLLTLVAAWLWLPGLHAGRLASAIAWLAVAGALASLLVGPLGGGQAWLNYRAWNLLGTSVRGITFSWDQSYGPIRWSRSQRTMFTVRAPSSQLWKTTTLDRFDGLRFVQSYTSAVSSEDLPLPLNDQWYQFATFTIKGLSSQLLPGEQGTTVGVNIGQPVRHNEDGTAQTMGPRLRPGQRYTVAAYVPRAAPAELRAAPRTFPRPYLRYTAFDLPSPGQSAVRLAATDPPQPGRFFTSRTVQAPAPGFPPAAPAVQRLILASPYGPMYRLARHLASGRRSSYDVATAIRDYLQANYTYGEQVPLRRDPLESFLFEDGTGYCQQFSGAMALMLRMDGIPARVAAGFLPGTYNSATGSYEVRAIDAHSWVEVFIEGVGWVPFDPTPPRVIGKVPRFPLYTSARSVTPAAAIAGTVGSLSRHSAQRIPTIRRSSSGPATAAVALLAVALVALVASASLAVRWLRGRLRLRRSLAGDGELAVAELARALQQMDYAVAGTTTLAQIEQRVRVQGGPDAADYVALLRDRRYAPPNGAVVTMRERRALRRALTAHLGLDARLRGLRALPPGTIAWRL